MYKKYIKYQNCALKKKKKKPTKTKQYLNIYNFTIFKAILPINKLDRAYAPKNVCHKLSLITIQAFWSKRCYSGHTHTHTHKRFFSLYLSKRLSLALLAHRINKTWRLPDNCPDRIITSSQLLHREIWFSFIFATFLEDPAYSCVYMMVVPRPDNTNFINLNLKLIKFEFLSSLFIGYLLTKRIFPFESCIAQLFLQ